MRSLTKNFLMVLLVCNPITVLSQQEIQRGENRFFREPRESILPVIVYQPGCPLLFERASYLRLISGGGFQDYQVRNQSQKPIVKFTIATVSLGGGGTRDYFEAKSSTQWLMPGAAWPEARDKLDTKSVPLFSEETGKQKDTGTSLKAIVFLMVVCVEFADGSTYTDEELYKRLNTMSEDVTLPK